jgi:hypothetical protein
MGWLHQAYAQRHDAVPIASVSQAKAMSLSLVDQPLHHDEDGHAVGRPSPPS